MAIIYYNPQFPNKSLLIFILPLFLAIHVSATDITTCDNLSAANTVYNLQNNVNNESNCFIILADNVTLDCHGYQINYSYSTRGHAVNNTAGYDNITIKNCNIVQGNSTP